MMFHTPLSPIIYAKLLGSKLAGEYQPKITATGMLKGNGNGNVVAATEGVDYGIVPAVTNDDNGKVAIVIDGKWAAADAIYGEIGLEAFNRFIAAGLGPMAAPVGTALTCSKETSLSVTVGNPGGTAGITGATVDDATFIAAIGHSDPTAYEFTFDGAAWHLDGVTVELSNYGITPTGAHAVDDEIVVHVAADEIPMNVLDYDYHTPADANIQHSCTLGMTNCYQNFAFDAPEALIKVVDGLAGGSHYYITLVNGAYGGGTGQDGVYGGTLAADQTIPAGGYLRHTTMGAYQSSYNASQITNGEWIAYDASFNQIGSQIATDSDDQTGTNFGTATAQTENGNSPHVNFTSRNAYGDNRLEYSNWLQFANASGIGWWVQKTEFDFPPSGIATLKGLLTGLDPVMLKSMMKVKIRTAIPTCDGGGYKDIETKVFPLSMTEVNLGANNSQYETSFGLDDTLKTTPLAFYTGATNADRVKTLNNAARYWWLRGPGPSYSSGVRGISTDGSLYGSGARGALGLSAAWVIGNPYIQSA